MDKLKMHSLDLTQDNVTRLRELFPGCVTEAQAEGGSVTLAVDFDQLRQELSASLVEGPQERYQLNWPGKREALLTANAPIAKTLRPAREESVDFDTTKNLFIEGDNLDALKLLQETYLGKVKMIYVDPPYNKGKDFIYKDNFSTSTEEYLASSGEQDEEGARLVANTTTNGRFHSDWISMMYPRVKLAHRFLSDDGIFFASIDESELLNLQKICEDVFGADNVLGNVPVVMNLKGNQDAYGFAETHEYVIVCVKDKSSCEIGRLPVDEEKVASEWDEDEHGLFKEADNLRATGVNAPREKRPNLWYPIYLDESSGDFYVTEDDVPTTSSHTTILPINPEGAELSWYWSKRNFRENKHNLILKKTANGWQFYKKQRPSIGDLPTSKPKSFFYKPEYSTSTATIELKNLFGRKVFETPKPVPFLMDLITIGTDEESVVMDFFAGSASTAHAVMQLNVRDGGKRRFILVQIPAEIPSDSEAFKAGYRDIAALARKRIELSAERIAETSGMKNFDSGFRVLKVDTSNMSDVFYSPDAIKQGDLIDAVDNIRPERSAEDLLFQVMLDWGVDLALPIETKTIQGKDVYFVDTDALAACFDKDAGIDDAFAKELAAHKPLRVVFRDAGFKDSAVKINIEQIFKLLSPSTEVKCL